jgi:hypothetical protein
MSAPCTHLGLIRDVEPRTPTGCEECLRNGSSWIHLRMCMSCGHVGCCDASPHRHSAKHFERTQHPVMRSIEPGEDWGWCFVDREPLPSELLEPPRPGAPG